jgi:hypothetical protein
MLTPWAVACQLLSSESVSALGPRDVMGFAQRLDEEIEAWRTRTLEGRYPCVSGGGRAAM